MPSHKALPTEIVNSTQHFSGIFESQGSKKRQYTSGCWQWPLEGFPTSGLNSPEGPSFSPKRSEAQFQDSWTHMCMEAKASTTGQDKCRHVSGLNAFFWLRKANLLLAALLLRLTTFSHPHRGTQGVQTDLYPWSAPGLFTLASRSLPWLLLLVKNQL